MKKFISQVVGCKKNIIKDFAEHFSPINIALIKYWGKEKNYKLRELNVPLTESLSVAIPSRGTIVKLSVSKKDILIINGENISNENKKFCRAFNYINLFRQENDKFKIETEGNIPTGSGLASSASFFASLAQCLNIIYGWNLNKRKLSIISRIGSGSAMRSIFESGFCEVVKKRQYTYAKEFKHNLKELYFSIIENENEEKYISSSQAMNKTSEISFLYKKHWKKQVHRDMKDMKKALNKGYFSAVGKIMQENALAMHSTMMSVGIIYWNEKTIENVKKIISLQESDVNIYFTIDAGAQVKIFSENEEEIKKYFPLLQVFKLI